MSQHSSAVRSPLLHPAVPAVAVLVISTMAATGWYASGGGFIALAWVVVGMAAGYSISGSV